MDIKKILITINSVNLKLITSPKLNDWYEILFRNEEGVEEDILFIKTMKKVREERRRRLNLKNKKKRD